MKEKGRLEKWNIYYKDIHLHPLCNYYFRCKRIDGETNWYLVYKYDSSNLSLGKVRISRYAIPDYIKWRKELDNVNDK